MAKLSDVKKLIANVEYAVALFWPESECEEDKAGYKEYKSRLKDFIETLSSELRTHRKRILNLPLNTELPERSENKFHELKDWIAKKSIV